MQNVFAVKKGIDTTGLVVYADKINIDGASASYLLSTVTNQGLLEIIGIIVTESIC